jgi:23S rRNA (adenine2503-C2)-methyltransferase
VIILINFYDLTIDDLAAHLVASGFKKFNATQIFEWVYAKSVFDFNQMTNIGKELKAYMSENFSLLDLTLKTKQQSQDGTQKFLFELSDGFSIESVLMLQDYGVSLCVTSQVGCNMGCSFCASGLKYKNRNLSVGELVMQVISSEKLSGQKITHIVVMGTGEPFDNYDNVIKFIKIVNDPKGLQIGQRHMTVSTCGIVPKIYDYADEPIRSNLAISLHAPNDELRTKIMKINKKYPLEDIIEACKVYFEKTSRRITFEYILLSGVNDSIELADQLSDLIRGLNAYVNLIPYNYVKEFGYERTDMKRAMMFYDRLIKRGINAILRKEQGGDIDAACGQLRMKSE